MSDALRFEWVRIRTLRSTYWLLGLAIVLSAAVAFILAFATRNEADQLAATTVGNILTGGSAFAIPFVPIFVSIVGVFATGHEYRHGTIQPTLTAIPQRSTLLTAKIVIVAVAALIATGVSVGLNIVVGLTFWSEVPDLLTSPLDQALPGYLAFALLNAVLGLALGLLFRGVPSALVVLLVVPTVVEGLIIGLSNVPALDVLVPVVKFLPFSAGTQLLATQATDYGPMTDDYDLFGRWAAGGVFAVFVGIILAVAWYLFQKRDA